MLVRSQEFGVRRLGIGDWKMGNGKWELGIVAKLLIFGEKSNLLFTGKSKSNSFSGLVDFNGSHCDGSRNGFIVE